METGFNIVEVPGSKSRKVADKKQQWYRTANSKMNSYYCNNLHFSAFQNNFTSNCYQSDASLLAFSLIWPIAESKLISFIGLQSVFSLKLQKTARFLFSGGFVLLVKSCFTFPKEVADMDLADLVISSFLGAVNLKNK